MSSSFRLLPGKPLPTLKRYQRAGAPWLLLRPVRFALGAFGEDGSNFQSNFDEVLESSCIASIHVFFSCSLCLSCRSVHHFVLLCAAISQAFFLVAYAPSLQVRRACVFCAVSMARVCMSWRLSGCNPEHTQLIGLVIVYDRRVKLYRGP